jgi:hypothetical protein
MNAIPANDAAQAVPHRLVRPHPYPFENRSIPHILEPVDRRLRIMCRMMQLYRLSDAYLDPERDAANLVDALTVSYEYVDQQMDTISALRGALELEGYQPRTGPGDDVP